MKSYRDYVSKYLSNFIKVVIPQEKIERINAFIPALIEQKSSEKAYQKDGNSQHKRFYTGLLGEAAVEELLGIEFIDWGLGESKEFNHADLKKLKLEVGVKTVEYGKFHVIETKAKRPEIIAIKKGDNVVYICGLALRSILKQYQDIMLINDPNLRAKGYKTGFYGYEDLIRFENLGVLKMLLGLAKK